MKRTTLSIPLLALPLVGVLASLGCRADRDTVSGPPPTSPSLAPAAVGGRYLVIATGNELPSGLAAGIAAAGGTVTATIGEIGIAIVESSNRAFAARAARIPGVRSVVVDYEIRWIDPDPALVEIDASAAISNPPSSGDDDFFFDLQWAHDAIDAVESRNAGALGAGARVAILDDGIRSTHIDLAPNLNVALSTSFVPGQTFDNPPGSHGTYTAGIVAAADNAFGIVGVAPQAEIVAVKVLNPVTGIGGFGGFFQGIVYAANIDADIINMSFGATLRRRGAVLTSEGFVEVPARDVAELMAVMGRAASYAYQQGATLIASAGNLPIDFDHTADVIDLPSGLPHVLSISATTPVGWAIDPSTDLDVPASYTAFGQSFIDFAAPGGDYQLFGTPAGNASCTVSFVTNPCWIFDLVFGAWGTSNSAYVWAGGTSASAPHVAGVAALIVGANGGSLHPAQVEAQLRASADDLGKPGKDDFYGDGRVNAFGQGVFIP